MTDMREEETAALQWQSRNTPGRNTPRRAGSQLPAARKNRKDMEALGVTRRQLEYWVEMGWVSSSDPPSQGHPRTFTETEKRVLALMVRLAAAGIPARRAAPLARAAVQLAVGHQVSATSVDLANGLYLHIDGI